MILGVPLAATLYKIYFEYMDKNDDDNAPAPKELVPAGGAPVKKAKPQK